MRDYELTLLVDPALTSAKQKTFFTKIKKMVTGLKGKVAKVDEWGQKELAFPINKKTAAVYVFVSLKLPADAVSQLDKRLKMEESLWRYLIVKKE